MLSLTLPPELEMAIVAEAQRQCTTPELLAIAALQAQLINKGHGGTTTPPGSLADFLGDAIGCLDSSQVTPEGAAMSQETGRKFAAGMISKRDQGKL